MSGLALRVAASSSRAARVASACTQSCRVLSRALHQRRTLSYPVEEGLGTFLPPPALKLISEDYQQGLLDRLNDQVRGTSLENKSIVQTIINAAQDPDKVLQFNYAAEALNNSFFLGVLKPPPADASSHEDVLYSNDHFLRRIHTQFGSLAQFQSTFSAAVLGMFSSGWVWLVTDATGKLGVVPTFGAGTLLVRSRQSSPSFDEWQRLVGSPTIIFDERPPLDPSLPSAPPQPSSRAPPSSSPSPASGSNAGGAFTATSPVSGVSHGAPALDPHTPARSASRMATPRGTYARQEQALNEAEEDLKRGVGATLFPLLCVSVHEHAWLSAGYGVWGKEEYMKRFWTVVDWEKVKTIYHSVTRTH